jgi:hypothetical protein
MSSPSYLLYDTETYRLFEGSYVTFDTNNFPLLDLLLAGETHTADKQVDVDGWRIAANTLIASADDVDLAHWLRGSYVVPGRDGEAGLADPGDDDDRTG